MTEPIVTEADRQTAIVVYSENRIIAIALALAQARAEGRLAGMEEAARKYGAVRPSGFLPVGELKHGDSWLCTHGQCEARPLYGCPDCCSAGCAEHPNEPHEGDCRGRARTTKEG